MSKRHTAVAASCLACVGGFAFGIALSEDAAKASEQPDGTIQEAPSRQCLIGLEVLPAAHEPWTMETELARFQQSLTTTGVNFLFLGPSWKDLEPKPGEYEFDRIDRYVEQAVAHDLPVACNIHMINTVSREMPDDLSALPFNDARVRQRLDALVNALVPRFKGRLSWLAFGNEVDTYFLAHQDEVSDFLELFRECSAAVKEVQRTTRTSTCITAGWFLKHGKGGQLAELVAACDYLHTTYYPLDHAGNVGQPDDMKSALADLVRHADGTKILFQELGCPSSPVANSSEERQSEFFDICFDTLENSPGAFIAANFMIMYDWPRWLVEGFGEYYNDPGGEKFLAFLESLGMFDKKGRPKQGWDVFKMRSLQLSDPKVAADPERQ